MNKIFLIILIFCNLFVYSQNESDDIDTSRLNTKIIRLNDFKTNDTFDIDTNQRFIHFYDPYEKNKLPVINLGQKGTPTLPLIFINRTEHTDFLFFTPYSQYIYIPNKSEYFTTNKPYTEIKYIGILIDKLREEQSLKLIHTQSPDKFTNFGLEYKLYTAMDISDPPQNSSINNLNVWYFKQIKRYKIYTSVFYNQIKRLENGGIIDTAADFLPYDENIRFYLSNVKNKLVYKGLFLNQSFDISTKLKIRHTSNYYTYSKVFYEETPNVSYFGPTNLTEEQSYDSTGIRTFDNTLDIIIGRKENFILGYKNRMQNLYYFRGFLYNLKGEFIADNSLFFGVHNIKFKKLNFNLFSNFHFTDRYAGNFELNNENKYSLNFAHKTTLSLNIKLKKQTPDYFYENYNGNYYSWSNNFNDITSLSFKFNAVFEAYNLKIGADFTQIKNYTYFDTLSLPAQDSNLLFLKTIWAKKTFNFQPFVLDLNFYYQIPNNQDILHIPEIIASSSLFIDVPLFKNALHLNFGVDVLYYSSFNTYAYNPALGLFHLDNTRISNNYPIANAFLTGKIKSAILIIKFDNMTGWLFSPYNETTLHYHISDWYLRFGVQWWFKN